VTAAPPRWSSEQLEAGRLVAIEAFRQQRMEEPLEAYLGHFDEVRDTVENLLEMTVDLSQITDSAVRGPDRPGPARSRPLSRGPADLSRRLEGGVRCPPDGHGAA